MARSNRSGLSSGIMISNEWAGILGNQEAAGILGEILNEEKAANRSLTGLARERSNQEALGESRGGDVEAAGAEKHAVSA